MSTTIRSIDHVQLPIPPGGGAQARAFYEHVLGLVERRDPAHDRPGTLRYGLGDQRLDLTEGPYAGTAPQAHLALAVADFPALARRVREHGVPALDAPLEDRRRLYVEDPFGNRLELIEQRAPGPQSLEVADAGRFAR